LKILQDKRINSLALPHFNSIKMKNYFFFTLILFLVIACARDSRERIFEINYPNILFNLPAGLSSNIAWGYSRSDIPTNFRNIVKANNSDTAVIAGVYPFAARISSLDGFDYDFVEQVSILMCSNEKNQCSLISDEVFYIDNLRGRAREVIELLPTERNIEKLLTEEQYRLEIVFYFRNSTPYLVESRLDLLFEAVK